MTTALYIRLSMADGDKPESESVKGQRDLLTNFISTHPELSSSEVLTFIDDDYTGTNLNRPGLQKMLEQAKKCEINTIIVKDFSRFARSSIDTNEYLELIFPFLNIRFISVTNNYDSDRHKGATAGMEAAIPALIAEMYSRDLSIKSKAAKGVKAKRGEFVGSFPCYGYVKSKTVKRKLEIDPEAADVIKKVFSLASSGMKPSEIARTLNKEGIDTPMTHSMKQNPNVKCYRSKGDTPYWSYDNIWKILRNETYMGKLISRKRNYYKFGSCKSTTVPKEDWIIVDGAIPAIITEDDYIKAQSVIKSANGAKLSLRNKSIFSHKVICGHCGYTLKRQHCGTYYCLSAKYIDRDKCFEGFVREEWLKSKVLEAYVGTVDSQCLTKQFEEQQEIDMDIVKVQLKKHRQSIQRLKDSKKNYLKNICWVK